MSTQPHIALMAAMPLPDFPAGGDLPTEIHLLPAPRDGRIFTSDGRGPYVQRRPMAEIIAASFARGDRIEIDINHATYHAAPRGERSDAYGWITAMHAREDGLWGTVEWTRQGAELVRDRAYRGISPALILDPKDPTSIVAIGNASLVNRPNLLGLTTLHQENAMNFMERLAEALGLTPAATEDDLLAAVRATKSGGGTALQSSLTAIGAVLGVAAEQDAIMAAARALKTAQPAEVVALQSQLAEVTTQLNTLTTNAARAAAEAVVDEAIRKGRVGVKPSRDRFIALHMADPAGTVALLEGMPVLQGALPTRPVQSEGGPVVSLNAEQSTAARLLGIPPADYLKALNADRKETV